jgi:hypothetical protein
MQLHCPNCAEPVPSQHINIQEMAAVCPACDTVFQFDIPRAKIKRRKVKQPERIALHERDDQLHLAFRTNFRLDQNENFLVSAIMGTVFGLLTLVLGPVILADGKPIILPLIFAGVSLVLFYYAALVAFNKTHIDLDNTRIRVLRRPLPNPLDQAHDLRLSGITAVRVEETRTSKNEGYDTPRYRVWAETEDGGQKLIVNEVSVDYALFIVQILNERLKQAAPEDLSHLLDDNDDSNAASLQDAVAETRADSR